MISVKPDEEVELICKDSSNGQITRDAVHQVLADLSTDAVNPVTGPVFVEGAEPGDALKIEFLDYTPKGWGWTGIIPGFGLLADDFTDPYLRHWTFDPAGVSPIAFSDIAGIPLRPFAGTVGVALKEPGRHSVIPPRHVGGNMDVRDLTAGSTLYLPVEVEGALLSIGDTHAAQGDGEVCGTAIESPIDVTVRIGLERKASLKMPRFTPAREQTPSPHFEVTTGVGSDLYIGAQTAVRGMIDLLSGRYTLSPEDAYVLCSVAGHLRISEIVDQPNFLVSFYFPVSIFY